MFCNGGLAQMSAYIRRLVNSPSAMTFTPSADNNVCCDMGTIQVCCFFLLFFSLSLSHSAAWSGRGNFFYPEFHTVMTGFPYQCPGSVVYIPPPLASEHTVYLCQDVGLVVKE